MTLEQIASESAQRIKDADNDAILAAEAIALGMVNEYLSARKHDIARRLNERYGYTVPAGGDGGEVSGSEPS